MSFDTEKTKPEQHPQTDTPYVTNLTNTMRKIDSGPSIHHLDDPKKVKQVPVDIVEEEGMESFPASDPPSHGRSNQPDARRPGQDA